MKRAKRKLIGRVNPETGEIVPTDGRHRKDKPHKDETVVTDYKVLYEKSEKKCIAQESLIEALQKEIYRLKEQR
jgi:hypothetical protein